MSDETLISYAQNGEDVVLWRALGNVTNGRYVDVGACDPVDLSVTKALYDRGWRGIDIDAVPEYAERLRSARPGNEVVHAAITDRPGQDVTLHQFVDSGLSTLLDDTASAHEDAGYARRDITVPARTLDDICAASKLLGGDLHLLKVDVEGAEAAVLRSFDLHRWKPWVVVVEATKPLTSEHSYEAWDPILTEAGYTFTLFDGLSRFYVSPDHADLVGKLSYPMCALDDYVPARQYCQDRQIDQLSQALSEARQEANRWRNQSVGYWANAVTRAQKSEAEAEVARSEASRLRGKLVRIRERLEQSRDDRRRLREKVQRLSARIEQLENRQQADGGVTGRLRAAVKKGNRA